MHRLQNETHAVLLGWQMNNVDAWQLVLQHEKGLRSVLSRYISKTVPRKLREQLMQEIWDEVVIDRVVSIMNTYDPQHTAGASPATHLFRNVMWYAFKWAQKRAHNFEKRREFIIRKFEREIVDAEPVYNMLDGLDERAANIIEWVAVQGFTFVEVADYLRTTPAKIRDEYYTAKMRLMLQMREQYTGEENGEATFL